MLHDHDFTPEQFESFEELATYDGWDIPERPLVDEIDELAEFAALAEDEFRTALWAESLPYVEHVELVARDEQLRVHDGIFS